MNQERGEHQAVVLFSGGMDSTVALYWAAEKWGAGKVIALAVNYGQRHFVELEAARMIGERSVAIYQEIETDVLSSVTRSKLLDDRSPIDIQTPVDSIVPNRNAFLMLLGHSLARRYRADNLIMGCCLGDQAEYPDCRPSFLLNLFALLSEGLGVGDGEVPGPRTLRLPIINRTKAQTFRMAEQMGILDVIVRETRTCYASGTKTHDWGIGCGECPSCKTRAAGWREFKGE